MNHPTLVYHSYVPQIQNNEIQEAATQAPFANKCVWCTFAPDFPSLSGVSSIATTATAGGPAPPLPTKAKVRMWESLTKRAKSLGEVR